MLEEPLPKLIVNRRTIAAAIGMLVGVPFTSAKALGPLTDVPLSFDPADFTGQMRDGLFLPDYRFPMTRVIFEDGTTTRWNRYPCLVRRKNLVVLDVHGNVFQYTKDTRAVAIEACAPDKNGLPRYSQLSIG